MNDTLKKYLCIGFLCLLFTASSDFPFPQAYSNNSDPTVAAADQLRQEKSYRLALDQYIQILSNPTLSQDQKREYQFKQADCAWRTQEADRFAEAEKNLNEIIESKDHDLGWAEANESLAEFYLYKDRWGYMNQIKTLLDNARNYWAGSSDLDLAKGRFIKLNFTLADFIAQNWGWYYNGIVPASDENAMPGSVQSQGLNVLFKEILEIATDDTDKAKATYSLGMCFLNQYNNDKEQKLPEKYFKELIEWYPASEWTDDAYYQLGQYYERQNDLEKALGVYRDLVRRFKPGDSPWVDDSNSRIKDITTAQLRVSVGYTFLPDSEIQFSLGWRNIKEASVTFYRLDLLNELQLNRSKSATDSEYGVENYSMLLKNLVDSRKYTSLPVELSFHKVLKDEGKHIWYEENKGLAEWQTTQPEEQLDHKKGVLPIGTYLLIVSSGETIAYELVMVTDMGMMVKTAGRSVVFFTFDSKSGAPVKGSQIKFQYRYYDDQGNWRWEEGAGQTDDSGILTVTLNATMASKNYGNQHELFACASQGSKQAFIQNYYYSYQNSKGNWWLYAFSDRPAYRPNEEVSFKGILRQYDGTMLTTPMGMPIKARIYDPRGNQVKEAVYSLNNFGSFADTLILDENAPLGEYRIELWTTDQNVNLGSSTLFRLEEYKLPEFLVNIKPKSSSDKEKTGPYRLGDRITMEVSADYYFGAAVANAEVEYLVYQNVYYHYYYPVRPYEWYYDQLMPQNNYYDNGQLITQGKIKTDEEGKADFTFETPANLGYDLRYHVEVRVVDQSRREIRSSNDIKVMRTSYLAYLNPKNSLYHRGDTAQVDVKTLDANDEPVATEGKITVTRNWWRDPVFEKEKTAQLIEDRESMVLPSRVIEPGHYEETFLLTSFVKTNERGEAVFEFHPEQDGYYTVNFTGYDEDGTEIKTSTNVFVCDKQSKDIGYRYGGLQIIPEKDTYKIGDTARIMLVSEKPDTWVLLTSEAEDIYDHQMIHLDGPVKMIELPIHKTYIPNIFFTASSASDYQLKYQEVQIIVPPEEKFLNVKITSDKEIYHPREKGEFEVDVTNDRGEPVAAELALGIVDASVYYIQSDYVPDLRKYFYGDKRNHTVSLQSSFNQRPYSRLVRSSDGKSLLDDRENEGNRRNGELGSMGGNKLKDDRERDKSLEFKSVSEEMPLQKAEMAASRMSVAQTTNVAPATSALKKMVASDEISAVSGGFVGGVGAEATLATPQLRTDFCSTVLWHPTIVTDQNGKAKITVEFPDSLTTWKTTARAITPDTSVGNITYENKTSKDIIVRLQAPRFFTERDKVTISANVHNYTKEEQKIKVTLNVKGLKLNSEPSVWVTIPAHDEKRVDWVSLADQPGVAELTVMAQTPTESDAMQHSYPVIPHGIEKFIANAVVLKGENNEKQIKDFILDIPKDRIPESTALQLVLSPSLAAAMLDALPYLADYPYGCVEQTMSRFLPAVIVAKTMNDLGFTKRDVDQYIRYVLEPRNDPKGQPQRREDETLSKLNTMTDEALKRLYDFQHPDGGWGWWKEGTSDRFMSAYVVWGLSLAQAAHLDIRADVLSRGINFLQNQLVEEENNPDMLAWMLHALAYAKSSSSYEDEQTQRLWDQRDKLNPYTRALFALSEFYRNHTDHAQTLARNLINGIQEDKDNHTAHWGESGIFYRWSEGGVEATSFCIKALANIDPQNPQLESAVKWLTLNRRGGRWKNTRDTAIAILGLADYLKKTDELTPDYTMEVFVNGTSIRQEHITQANIFTFNRIVDLPSEALQDGINKVSVEFTGKGSLYLSSYLKYFTKEENITAAGNEVFVKRQYFREDKKKTLFKSYTSQWVALNEGDQLKSGDRVRVDILLEAKNNYEYLLVEDLKPAGFEAVELKSGDGSADFLDQKGYETGETTWLYQEFRDQKAAFFIPALKQGTHRLRYELRAEVPGEFHGMPNQVHAMYVPEIRASSDEIRFLIFD